MTDLFSKVGMPLRSQLILRRVLAIVRICGSRLGYRDVEKRAEEAQSGYVRDQLPRCCSKQEKQVFVESLVL